MAIPLKAEIDELVLNCFKRTKVKNITLSSLLSDWDEITLTALFAALRRQVRLTHHCILRTLSSRDISDEDKVGRTVGSLSLAVHEDLSEEQPAFAAATGPNAAIAGAEKSGHVGAYLQGFLDALRSGTPKSSAGGTTDTALSSPSRRHSQDRAASAAARPDVTIGSKNAMPIAKRPKSGATGSSSGGAKLMTVAKGKKASAAKARPKGKTTVRARTTAR